VFHGKRGELRQRYREGQEDQLGALGLVVNMIVLWNTIYLQAALEQLRAEDYPVREEDVVRLSPLGHEHINLLGRYSFAVPKRSPGASSGRSETPLTAITNRTFGSIAPQTPISRRDQVLATGDGGAGPRSGERHRPPSLKHAHPQFSHPNSADASHRAHNNIVSR